jgi:hypothetical protein
MFDAQAGAAYPLLERLRLIAQVNCRVRDKDHADPPDAEDGDHDHELVVGLEAIQQHEHVGTVENTGGTAVFLSPGLRYDVSPVLGIGSYVQVPVYQDVNGTQVAANAQFWIGMTYRR